MIFAKVIAPLQIERTSMDRIIGNKVRVFTEKSYLSYSSVLALGLQFRLGQNDQDYLRVGILLGRTLHSLEFQWNQYWNY